MQDKANERRPSTMETSQDSCDNDNVSDSASEVGFASVDFTGVDFDAVSSQQPQSELSQRDLDALALEHALAFGEFTSFQEAGNSCPSLVELARLLDSGQYTEVLSSDTARRFLADVPNETAKSVASLIRQQVFANGDSIAACVELELLGIAALNLFLQANYTGPTLHEDSEALSTVNPHSCFRERLSCGCEDDTTKADEGKEEKQESLTKSKRSTRYQNAILSELVVEGGWPCQVSNYPYFLLFARSILLALTRPTCSDWTHSFGTSTVEDSLIITPPSFFVQLAGTLRAARLWCARSAVAHERLLQARDPTATLWDEVRDAYLQSIEMFCGSRDGSKVDHDAARVMLEWGLAEHYFDKYGKGKGSFLQAQQYSGLKLQVTGAEGKRTKYQKKATAQMLVKASSAASAEINLESDTSHQVESIRRQMVEHSEDGILLERIKFEDDEENKISELSVLDQAILLALCLDVKNNNPADALTAEEMGGFLTRVLDHHDDWMVYSTALLERAWLEFERSHGRERAILQIQALADQHTERLTITQSTRKSIKESAPVQDRLKMLHYIVYPPRWSVIHDLADRYAALGIVTSAAELFTEIEMWDDVVNCYRRAGKVSIAEKIVRECLEVAETPRMWSALGDLTDDPEHYRRAIALSKGRFAEAHVALGAYYFKKGDLPNSSAHYEQAVKVRPLLPHVWFRLGTISMQLKRWDTALRAFSEVVQQQPDEADAWANVAAVHMHNKQPSQAYPALVESLKQNRNNWRVWVSKLYTCLDLEKYDEAVQACIMILDLRASRAASDRIPPLEARCVTTIVAGSLKDFREKMSDEVATESTRRTLTRVYQLLHRISSSSDAEPWVFETMAFFHEQVGQDEKILDDLMKEYRSLQAVAAWEKDDYQIRKICGVVSHVVSIHVRDGSRDSLTKAKWLARGVVTKIRASRPDDPSLPDDVQTLQALLESVEEKLASDLNQRI